MSVCCHLHEMEAIKPKTDSGQHLIMDNAYLKSKSDVRDKYCMITDREGKAVSGFASCKQCRSHIQSSLRKLQEPSSYCGNRETL